MAYPTRSATRRVAGLQQALPLRAGNNGHALVREGDEHSR